MIILSKTNTKTRYGKRFTKLLFIFIALLMVLGVVASTQINPEQFIAQLSAIDQTIEGGAVVLFIWRVFLYTVLVGVLFIVTKNQRTSNTESKPVINTGLIRISCYLVLFELLLVQNTVSRLVTLVTG